MECVTGKLGTYDDEAEVGACVEDAEEDALGFFSIVYSFR